MKIQASHFLLLAPAASIGAGPSTRRRSPRPAPRRLRPPSPLPTTTPSPTAASPSPLLLLHGQIHAGVLLHLWRRAASPSDDGSPGEDATSSVRCTASPSYRKSSRCRPSSSARSAISPGGLPCQLPNDALVPPRGRHTSTFTEPQGASPPFSTAAIFDARSTASSPVLMYEAADDDFSSTPIVDWTPDFSANVSQCLLCALLLAHHQVGSECFLNIACQCFLNLAFGHGLKIMW